MEGISLLSFMEFLTENYLKKKQIKTHAQVYLCDDNSSQIQELYIYIQ